MSRNSGLLTFDRILFLNLSAVPGLIPELLWLWLRWVRRYLRRQTRQQTLRVPLVLPLLRCSQLSCVLLQYGRYHRGMMGRLGSHRRKKISLVIIHLWNHSMHEVSLEDMWQASVPSIRYKIDFMKDKSKTSGMKPEDKRLTKAGEILTPNTTKRDWLGGTNLSGASLLHLYSCEVNWEAARGTCEILLDPKWPEMTLGIFRTVKDNIVVGDALKTKQWKTI